MRRLSVSDLVTALKALPGPDNPALPPALNELVFNILHSDRLLPQIVSDHTLDSDTRFRAFYGYLNVAIQVGDTPVLSGC